MTRLLITLLALTTMFAIAIRVYEPPAAAAPRQQLPPCPYFCGDTGPEFPNHAACLAACPTVCELGFTPFACQP